MNQPWHVNQARSCLSPCPPRSKNSGAAHAVWGQGCEQRVMGKHPSGKPSRASQELECPGLWGCWNVGLEKRRRPRICLRLREDGNSLEESAALPRKQFFSAAFVLLFFLELGMTRTYRAQPQLLDHRQTHTGRDFQLQTPLYWLSHVGVGRIS